MSYDNYIVVGQVLTTHGIKGFLTIKSYTSTPRDIFKYILYIKLESKIKKIEIEDHNFMPKKTIMKIEGVNNIEDCQSYIGKELLVTFLKIYIWWMEQLKRILHLVLKKNALTKIEFYFLLLRLRML